MFEWMMIPLRFEHIDMHECKRVMQYSSNEVRLFISFMFFNIIISLLVFDVRESPVRSEIAVTEIAVTQIALKP